MTALIAIDTKEDFMSGQRVYQGVVIVSGIVLFLLLRFRCESVRDSRPMPGYSGSVPSAQMQSLLKSLDGLTFHGTHPPLSGADWTVRSGFVVGPYPGDMGTIKGPHAILDRAGAAPARASPHDVRYIPVTTDDEARALVALVRKNASGPDAGAPDTQR